MANKSKKTKSKININLNRNVVLLVIFILIIVITAIFLSSILSDYSKITLASNNNQIFNVSDLTIDNLTYMSTEKDVIKKYGKPKKETSKEMNNYKYKIFEYDGLKITLKEYYDTYSISKVEITSSKYTISNNIKVGNKILSVINKYRVTNKRSEYIYGDYSSESLNNPTIRDAIEYGKRNKTTVVYVNRDAIISNQVDIPTNIAKLILNYKNGKVTKITWSYDIK